MSDPINLDEMEAAARDKLPAAAYDYYASGAHDEITLRENHRAYDRISLRYRVLMDVSRRDLATTVLGERVAMPVLVAPTAFHGLANPEGEVATARAASKAGTIMTLSTLANRSLEDVAACGGPLWFQLYVYRDRGATRALVERAEAVGCKALVLTVDAPLLGCRWRDERNGFCLPEGLTVANLSLAKMDKISLPKGNSGLAKYFASLIDQSLSWKDVEWLRSMTRLPVVVKGLVRGDDAVRAADSGVAAVIVSNHGGRQLDTAPPTIEVLPEIVEAVDGRVEVLIDGGVRRGTDVVKALALGARAVLVGRPLLWGLACDGEAGVTRVLNMLRDELDLAMALCGCPSIASVGRDLVVKQAMEKAVR